MQVFSSLEDHPFCLGRYLNKWKLCDDCVLSDLKWISRGDWYPGFGRNFVWGVGQGSLFINIFPVKTMYGGIRSEWNEQINSSMLFWKGKIFSLDRGPTSSEHERCKSFILISLILIYSLIFQVETLFAEGTSVVYMLSIVWYKWYQLECCVV